MVLSAVSRGLPAQTSGTSGESPIWQRALTDRQSTACSIAQMRIQKRHLRKRGNAPRASRVQRSKQKQTLAVQVCRRSSSLQQHQLTADLLCCPERQLLSAFLCLLRALQQLTTSQSYHSLKLKVTSARLSARLTLKSSTTRGQGRSQQQNAAYVLLRQKRVLMLPAALHQRGLCRLRVVSQPLVQVQTCTSCQRCGSLEQHLTLMH